MSNRTNWASALAGTLTVVALAAAAAPANAQNSGPPRPSYYYPRANPNYQVVRPAPRYAVRPSYTFAPAASRYTIRAGSMSSARRDWPTGRNVPLAKPWLDSSR